MGNKLRHEGDEVRIKVIWPDKWPFSIATLNYQRVLLGGLEPWNLYDFPYIGNHHPN